MTQPYKDQALYRHEADLGGLPFLQAQYYKQRFARHVHEGYCIGVIDTGAQRFLREGAQHLAPRDSIILVNADQVHDGHCAADMGWSYRAIYPTEAMLSPLCESLTGRSSGLPWFSEPVVHDPEMANRLRGLYDTLTHSDNRLARETLFVDTMTDMLRRHGQQRSTLPKLLRHPRAVRRACDYIQAHLADNITLSDLAQQVGLSPYYLTRLFRQHLDMPPHHYQIACRIQRAQALLRTGVPVSEVALQVGFNDQSHFSRHFKRMVGTTPGRYALSH